jgi:hypothetical protein
VLEIRQSGVAIITCQDEPSTLDTIPVIAGALSCRVAPDELLVVGAKGDAATLLSRVAALQERTLSCGIAMDVSDAWSTWTVSGVGVDQVLRRLSGNRMPAHRPALVQGAFARVGAKLLLVGQTVHIMVPSPVGHYLRERLMKSCSDLAPRVLAPAPLPVDEHGAILRSGAAAGGN